MSVDRLPSGAYTDLQSLQGLKREARQPDASSVREAARQFESLFTRMMLSSMRKASMGDSLFDSREGGFYREMFDDQLAVDMSRGRGLGLADMLVEQLGRAGLIPPETPAGASRGGVAPLAGGAGSAMVAPATASADSAPAADAFGIAQRRAFLSRLQPHAEAAGRALGVAPETLLAHAALETGWGQSMPADAAGRGSFNLFGIKTGQSWHGAAVNSQTVEFVQGAPRLQVEPFRAYGSESESIADYVSLLSRSSRYAEALGTGEDTAAFAGALQRGGYATDPRYAQKLEAVAASVRSVLGASLKSGNELPINRADTL